MSSAVSTAAHHLVKRAVSEMPRAIRMVRQPNSPSGDTDGDGKPQGSPMALFILATTTFAFLLVLGIISYTLGMIVPTLAIVEDPQPAAYVSIDSVDDDGRPKTLPGADSEHLVQKGPITTKIRTTLKHLRARGGFWAPFRGMAVFLLYVFSRSILVTLFSFGASYSHLLTRSLATIAAEVALTAISLTWVHTVISEPSANARPFWRRIPAYRIWRKVVPAVALQSVASQICFLIPLYLGIAIHSIRMDDESLVKMPQLNRPTAGTAAGSIAILLLTLALTVLIEIPATVTMIRVAASALSPDVDTIVPFDRTFNGKIEPAVLGGGCLGLLDAWKSFTWPSRVRLMKLVAKYFAITMAVGFAFGAILAVEIVTVAGGTVDKVFDGKN
ncbi:hypothetical protein CPC735_035920 [Coccidioides posadasii C735 delta SOWgp]|uniref:Uncharacterized protein n=2 Tax=Coccidioides posadasii TaxID=199306 RepID=A0A0J6F415_COCPO|nr:hypothetical protein CPC735_035920 [Coccidioides posadasii C735 delta SOWgp]EER28886.1 hypothetical protein CPC735_035920 [Coccidioides posadasii C735 delta SOWgp]KMM63704.1 hypothetical protein CPAG_00058 [Coccidioides posadasii RMSCC 3488]|eukprot:XP_003071031.1 hypothetical protein CPC735_035920 [Coccidioides posadasii C735 delta SOWgp]